jgi:cytochrome c556
MTTVAATCALALAVLSIDRASGQVKQGKTRPIKTQQLMKGLVAVQCGALKKGLDAGPADDAAWAAVATSAALLNETGYTLLADGRCPDAAWAGAAKTLSECSAEVLKAIDAKDADAAKTAFGAMTKACAACHEVHRPKK